MVVAPAGIAGERFNAAYFHRSPRSHVDEPSYDDEPGESRKPQHMVLDDIKTERSAPREPGAVLAVSEKGDVAGSVTGGCVEPAVYEEAQDVLTGGPPRLVS